MVANHPIQLLLRLPIFYLRFVQIRYHVQQPDPCLFKFPDDRFLGFAATGPNRFRIEPIDIILPGFKLRIRHNALEIRYGFPPLGADMQKQGGVGGKSLPLKKFLLRLRGLGFTLRHEFGPIIFQTFQGGAFRYRIHRFLP
jgi:hypothetical protein